MDDLDARDEHGAAHQLCRREVALVGLLAGVFGLVLPILFVLIRAPFVGGTSIDELQGAAGLGWGFLLGALIVGPVLHLPAALVVARMLRRTGRLWIHLLAAVLLAVMPVAVIGVGGGASDESVLTWGALFGASAFLGRLAVVPGTRGTRRGAAVRDGLRPSTASRRPRRRHRRPG